MKRIISLLIALFIFSSFSLAGPQSETEKVVKVQTSAICKMCKSRLERALSLSSGVTNAKLDLTDKVMTVTYKPKKTSEGKIRDIISKTGYQADNVPAVESAHDRLPKCCQRTATPH